MSHQQLISVYLFISGMSYDVLADPPSDSDDASAQQIVFESSELPFLPIYFLQLDKMRQYVLHTCIKCACTVQKTRGI